jgi:hypothetical protein
MFLDRVFVAEKRSEIRASGKTWENTFFLRISLQFDKRRADYLSFLGNQSGEHGMVLIQKSPGS